MMETGWNLHIKIYKKNIQLVAVAGLCVLLVAWNVMETGGTSSQELRQQYEWQRDEALEKADEADALQEQIDMVNQALTYTAVSMSETQQKIRDLEEQIQQNQESMLHIEEERDALKDQLYQFIRASYRHELQTDFVTVLVHSDSFTDFWQQSRYASEMLRYFRERLEDYKDENALAAKRQEELDALRGQAREQEEQLKESQEQFTEQVAELSKKLKETEEQERETRQEMSALSERIAAMETAEREAMNRAGTDYQGTWTEGSIIDENDPDYQYVDAYQCSDTEKVLLAGIIQAEAGSTSYPGMIAVGSVVMNRVADSRFPNTITGVVYAPNQFSPVASGRLAVILAQGPVDACMQAAQDVLNGKRNVNNLYFKAAWYAEEHGISGVNIGGNVFH